MKRRLAIGDIHGCYSALQTLSEAVGFSREDELVFLGDYIDRGPDSKGVVDFLSALQDDGYDVKCLRGNHELMMERAREGGPSASLPWLRFGGAETLDSYDAKIFSDVPDAHWEFIENLLPFYETEEHIFVHAGVASDVALDEQTERALYWDFFDDPEPHDSGKTVICGHSSQKNGRPVSVGHAVCIDTFVYGDGWLTCLEVATGHCWRSRESGELREDELSDIANAKSVH